MPATAPSTAVSEAGPTALVADDEPLLRERLVKLLASAWPALQVVAEARNGREALELFDELVPDVVFLDVHMPGLNGVEAARGIARRAEVVFATAYEQYAVQAFEQGAVDYLVKPFDAERLADTVQRLQPRVLARRAARAGAAADVLPGPASALDPALESLAQELRRRAMPGSWLQWIKASVGPSLRLIPVEQVIYLRSDEKYTLVAWEGGEALIRRTIRELADELDPDRFMQVHRSVIVNLGYVTQVVRGANETADVHLRGRPERLPVSRSYLHVFRQM
ncbi:MAG: LytTR family DNA-binding domain-containing protein [Rubrivivax sp.]